MALVLFPETHTYQYDGRLFVGVTAVLTALGLRNSAWDTDEAQERGTRVHQACCRLDEGREVQDDLALPYMPAYERFRAECRPAWTHLEAPVCDPTLEYAGTVDRAGLVNGRTYVVDIKTGQVPASVALQTAAYARCLLAPIPYRRASLALRVDGVYRFDELTDRNDEGLFLAALALYRWKEKHGLL